MDGIIDHTKLHRGAKIFMDNGRSATYEEAMALLGKFGLTIVVGEDITSSVACQTALLSLINIARRTFLAGIDVIGLPDCASKTSVTSRDRLIEAVVELGGKVAMVPRREWPTALIGNATTSPRDLPAWKLTWEGWRGGVIPANSDEHLANDEAMPLAPVLAAAACAAEAFAVHAGDHVMAGRRTAGLSLWHPGANWLAADDSESALVYLPSRLWLIGLGNLGQAFSWLLACLPYEMPRDVHLVLQDYDRIAESNDSTSMLSWIADIGKKKSRVVADWLEARGFTTYLEERRFGSWTRRSKDEPGLALCGVDNANARAVLHQAGFDLIVEAGLGGGPQAFRNMSLHTFPASRTPAQIWGGQIAQAEENFEAQPAYQALKQAGMDKCGLTQLASRTVGVPFVGLIAACLAIAEVLRRLHGGIALEFLSTSASTLDDIETGALPVQPYAHGYVDARKAH
jgi:hypothetical protein